MDMTAGVQFSSGTMMGLFFSSPHADRLWGPPSLLCNGHQMLLLRK